MSELIRDIFRRMHMRSLLGSGRIPISILPLREASLLQCLPWEPGSIELRPNDRQLLAGLWRELSYELAPEEAISECDVLKFALQELQLKLKDGNREDMLLRLEFHLRDVQQ